MFEVELENVRKVIDRLHKNNKLRNKNICLFGVSDSTRQVIQVFRMLGYEPVYIIDNDPIKQKSYCSMIKVVPLDMIPRNGKTIIFIYSMFWREMQTQAIKAGFCAKQIKVLYEKDKTLANRIYEGWLGKKIYRKLVSRYGDVSLFLCPYTGTGDVYLIGTFWHEYILNNKIEDYVFIVINEACRKVALLFNIKNVELLKNQKESEYLIRYYSLCPTEIRLKVLNDGWAKIRANPTEWFRGYKGLYFTELFRKFVFRLPDTSRPRHPQFLDVSNQIKQLFEENGLIENKTVIISPYSNTLSDLPNEFWIKITDALLKKGYIVCTNSSGKHEPAIGGSIPVFFPLNIAPQFVKMAGVFIGVRSGFCDVISGASVKKIILYDAENRFYNCSAYEYFSLNHMGLCSDAVEIRYKSGELAPVVSMVLDNI